MFVRTSQFVPIISGRIIFPVDEVKVSLVTEGRE